MRPGSTRRTGRGLLLIRRLQVESCRGALPCPDRVPDGAWAFCRAACSGDPPATPELPAVPAPPSPRNTMDDHPPQSRSVQAGRDEADPAVRMVDADPTWPARFAAEAARIRAALGQRTARRPRRLDSRPRPSGQADHRRPALRRPGPADGLVPTCPGRPWLPAHPYPDPDGVVRYPFFGRPPTGPRAFHVHVAQAGSHHERRHLAVRDYLRAHPDQARDYERSRAPPRRATPVTGQATWQPSRRSWTTSSAVRWSGTTSSSLQDDLGSPATSTVRRGTVHPIPAALTESHGLGKR
jgi:GrpB protein